MMLKFKNIYVQNKQAKYGGPGGGDSRFVATKERFYR